jgi:hypothetical protein
MSYKLSEKDCADLRNMTDSEIIVIERLFAKMASHPFQVTDAPGRNLALSLEASIIMQERGL